MDISAQWGLNAVSNASEFILDESMLPEQVVDDLRRYLLQRSLTIGKASTRKLNGDEIHSGKAILRGLDCQIDVYLAGDKSLMVLCAKPERPESFWKFSECFPEIPDAAAAKDFFFGNPPQEFKEPLLAKVGLADSVWVLISAADERLIEQNAHDILAKMGTWLKNRTGYQQTCRRPEHVRQAVLRRLGLPARRRSAKGGPSGGLELYWSRRTSSIAAARRSSVCLSRW